MCEWVFMFTVYTIHVHVHTANGKEKNHQQIRKVRFAKMWGQLWYPPWWPKTHSTGSYDISYSQNSHEPDKAVKIRPRVIVQTCWFFSLPLRIAKSHFWKSLIQKRMCLYHTLTILFELHSFGSTVVTSYCNGKNTYKIRNNTLRGAPLFVWQWISIVYKKWLCSE